MVFLDANPVIYLIEQPAAFGSKADHTRCQFSDALPSGRSLAAEGQVRGSKTFLGYARPWQSSSRRTGALSGRFARAIRRDQPIRAPESAAIHDRCAGVGSGRRASAQVRNALHAQPLGDVPQTGPTGREEPAQKTSLGQPFQPHAEGTRPCCPDDRGSRRRRAIQPGRVIHELQVTAEREPFDHPFPRQIGRRPVNQGRIPSATAPDPLPPPSQERCQRATAFRSSVPCLDMLDPLLDPPLKGKGFFGKPGRPRTIPYQAEGLRNALRRVWGRMRVKLDDTGCPGAPGWWWDTRTATKSS